MESRDSFGFSVRDSSGTPDGGWRVGCRKQKVTERNFVLDNKPLDIQQRSKTYSPANSMKIGDSRLEIGDLKSDL